MSSDPSFLPGVPDHAIRAALAKAAGRELESGKLASPQSSAALAVNAFGWFLERPFDLPPLPTLSNIGWPAVSVQVERQMRFPWRGGRHPWLDAAIETHTHIVGVESKRFEPFRDAKSASLSAAYDRDVWGDQMTGFLKMRDRLRAAPRSFSHLDAAQLVKHAFGLVTEGRRVGKAPVLFYLFAEPERQEGRTITAEALARHRDEVAEFAASVCGSAVRFAACSYREWLASWRGDARRHANAILAHFSP